MAHAAGSQRAGSGGLGVHGEQLGENRALHHGVQTSRLGGLRRKAGEMPPPGLRRTTQVRGLGGLGSSRLPAS